MMGKFSSCNNSSLHPQPCCNAVLLPLDVVCFTYQPNTFVFGAFNMTNILFLLPLSTIILHHGLQQRLKSSTSSSAPLMTHSDIFTFHLVLMELIAVTGCILNFWSICTSRLSLLMAGVFLYTFTYMGEQFFHMLTCAERYLAVVHPITYLSLKSKRGIRIRNVSISCAWLFSFIAMALLSIEHAFLIINFFFTILSLILVSFCSLSVLRVLISPGPGGQGGGKVRVDQSKQKAFYTIIAILGVLLMRFVWDLTWAVLFTSGNNLTCVLITCNLWLTFPSSLLLPLLFLHRAGKLSGCKKMTQVVLLRSC